MNKQVLTKTFSFSKWLLLFFLTFGLTLTGCKEDYDDDISNLQAQLDKLSDYQDVKTKISTLETALGTAQSEASAAATKANEAITNASTAQEAANAAKAAADEAKQIAESGGGAAGEAAAAAQAAADAAQAAADQAGTDAAAALAAAQAAAADAVAKAEAAKNAAIADAETKLAAVKAELEEKIAGLSGLDPDALEAMIKDIVADLLPDLTDLEAQVSKLISHRLTSLVRIPNQTLNDEPAIFFKNITYVPQVYNDLHTAYTQFPGGVETDHMGDGEVTIDIAGAKRFYIANNTTEVKYQVSPKLGVREQDIKDLYFMGDIQENLEMRAVSKTYAGENKPIEVASWKLDASTGILTVYATKSKEVLNENINFEGQGTDIQKYYIASLRAPIAKANWTAEEIEADAAPEVASDYSRIAETYVSPMIKQLIDQNGGAVAAHKPHSGTYDRMELLNGRNDAGRFVHFHDRKSVYGSGSDQLVDYTVKWDEDVDLRKYVTVCEFENVYLNPNGTVNYAEPGTHNNMDYKAYGLEFRFAIDGKYLQGTHQTDQQQFAKILKDGYTMNSKTYDIDEKNKTAVDREPIVRVQLIDTKNSNNLVAERYIKFKWTANEVSKPITIDMGASVVSCKMIDGTVGTKQMNEQFYYALLEEGHGWTKEQFHAVYKKTELISLTKDGSDDNLLTNPPLDWTTLDDTYNSNAGITSADADAYAKVMTAGNAKDDQVNEDVIFAMAKDQNDPNMSYNLKWYMSPEAVGTIAKDVKGTITLADGTSVKYIKASDYELKVKFVAAGQADVIVTFKHKVVVPDQNFVYESTYWQTGATGTTYNVNPIVYVYDRDYLLGGTPNFAAGAWTGWNTSKDSYNHIGADLVKGWRFTGTNLTPANVDQFIQYIRYCAKVRFEFDHNRFGQGDYAYLANYTVTNDRQALWSNASQAPLTDPELQTYSHPGAVNDARYDKLAATLWNRFGADALENQKPGNLPYANNEDLISGVNEAVSQLWLSEINPSDGSTAANSLIGKKVPMQLVVEYNAWNKVPVQTFEVNIYDPLKVSPLETDGFMDAVINGSYINVQNGLSYKDWDGNFVSRSVMTPPADATEYEKTKYRHTQELWDYYQVRDVVFQTASARTNIKLVGNAYRPDNTVDANGNYVTKNGELPSGTTIKQIESYDLNTGANFVETTKDPVYLRYYNDYGTPVNETYQIFMDVVVGYKWGRKVSEIRIPVLPAGGTPGAN